MHLKEENEFNSEFLTGSETKIPMVRFSPSVYLDDYNDFWKIGAILGYEYVGQKIKENNYVIDQDFIETIFQNSAVKFYFSKDKNKLYSSNKGIWKKSGPFEKLSAFDALENYGIDTLEIAIEKGVASI